MSNEKEIELKDMSVEQLKQEVKHTEDTWEEFENGFVEMMVENEPSTSNHDKAEARYRRLFSRAMNDKIKECKELIKSKELDNE